MTVPEDVFSCCCDWGFEFVFKQEEGRWYLATKITSPSDAIKEIGQSSGGVIDTHYFSLAEYASAIDDEGNFYLLHDRFSTSSSTAIAVSKVELDGTLIWEYSPDGYDGLATALPMALALDSSRNVYLAYVYSAGAKVEKIDSSGNHVWTASYESPDQPPTWDAHFITPLDINVAGARVHVTGRKEAFVDGDSFSYSRFEWQLDTDGNEIWSEEGPSSPAAATSYDAKTNGTRVVFNSSGDVVILYSGSTGDDQLILVSYDSSGNVIYEYMREVAPSPVGYTLPWIRDIEMLDDKLYYVAVVSTNIYIGRLSGSDLQTEDWETLVDSGTAFNRPSIRVGTDGSAYIAYGRGFSAPNHYYASVDSSGNLRYTGTTDGNERGASLFAQPMIPPGRPPAFI